MKDKALLPSYEKILKLAAETRYHKAAISQTSDMNLK